VESALTGAEFRLSWGRTGASNSWPLGYWSPGWLPNGCLAPSARLRYLGCPGANCEVLIQGFWRVWLARQASA